MKTCKDCFHNEVCPTWDYYNDEPMEDFHCGGKNFKDRNRILELPCAVGDTVWIDGRTWGNTWNFKKRGEFLIGEIISIVKTRKQTLIKIQAEHNVSWKIERKRYPIGAIGKTVFLSRKAEEEALKKDGGK